MEFKMYFRIYKTEQMAIEVSFKEGHSKTINAYSLSKVLKTLIAFKFDVQEHNVDNISKDTAEDIENYTSIEI